MEMMRQAEGDIRKQLPNFSAAGICGANFDIFHQQPSHQRNLLAALKGIHRTEITIGGRCFSLVACPVNNEGGERLGTVVEWHDRTTEIKIENEVAEIIGLAASGDFSRRLDSSRMNGFLNRYLMVSTICLKPIPVRSKISERCSLGWQSGTFPENRQRL
jgi:methyl-accepting chemotaxis protein